MSDATIVVLVKNGFIDNTEFTRARNHSVSESGELVIDKYVGTSSNENLFEWDLQGVFVFTVDSPTYSENDLGADEQTYHLHRSYLLELISDSSVERVYYFNEHDDFARPRTLLNMNARKQ